MSQTLRTFIGIALPCSARLRDVLQSCRDFGRCVRPVAGENMHVTLRFLGPTPAEQVGEISRILTESLRRTTSFSAELRGLGAFPSIRRPSVVWAGFRDAAPWMEMAEAIERPLRQLGFSGEQQQFHPHVTLARVRGRPPAELINWIEQQAEAPLGDCNVRAVALYQSDLAPGGPRYTPLSTTALVEPVQ